MNVYRRKRDYSGGSHHLYNGEVSFFKSIQKKFNLKLVVDVGVEKSSHIVDYRLNDDIKIFLFEPNNDYAKFLLKIYENKKNVIIKNVALGNIDNETLKLYPSTGSIFYREKTIPAKRLSKDFITISSRTIDSIVEEEKLEKIDFLKIDVEGFELNVLLGAKNCCENIDLIQFEYGGTYVDAGITIEQILSMFSNRYFYAIENKGLNRMTFDEACKENKFTNFLVSKIELENV